MEVWHVLNRGVDGRDLFLDNEDLLRFVHNLYEFNDSILADQNVGYRFKSRGLRDPYIQRERELLVKIHGWCLMKNHYHLILSELVENGLTLFLRKLNTGYANYFNLRHERIGTLFSGRTKRILIERHSHFLYVLHYVHLNPLDYLEGAERWRERSKGGIASANEVLRYLETYRWSSYLDYAGTKNFPSLIDKELFESAPGEYVADLRQYLRDAESPITTLGALTLE